MFLNYYKGISGALLAFLVILLSYVANRATSSEETGCPTSHIREAGGKNKLIDWTQYQASSETDTNLRLAYKIRLNAPGNWLPAEDDNEPWHQVDFAITMWLHSITTKGSSKSDQWVTHYRISYAESDGILKNFTDSGVVKIFSGNVDRDTGKSNDFTPAISARFIRLHPINWSGRPALRLEYYGCYKECAAPKVLPFEDSQITAKDHYSSYTARYGRIEHSSGWMGDSNSVSWLMVDFVQRRIVTAVSARGSTPYSCTSPSFTLEYSSNGNDFEDVMEHGNSNSKQFTGLSVGNIKRFTLPYPIFARFLRFKAALTSATVSPTGARHSALRIEVEGCHSNESWFLSVPLGMSGNLILDSQISASSSMSYTSGPGNARLGLTTIPGVQDGGWIAGDHDREPWLQVDFIVNATVKGLRKQNLYDSTHSVTKYTLAYGDDGETFSDYKTNNQKGTEVLGLSNWEHLFPYIFARFIRIYPKECNGSCAMRVEFYGHYEGCRNPKALGMENKQILNSQLSASTWAKGMEAPRGRLNGALAWRADLQRSNFEVWYQVDFIKRAKITSLKARGGTSYYVKEFKLFYSNNEIDFLEYKDVMGTKEFTGHDVRDTVVLHLLANLIVSRFLRVYPTAISSSYAELQLEFFGCYVDTIVHESIPLGMENGLILDAQLHASSEKYYRYSGAARGRFNSTTLANVRSGGWIAADDDSEPWFEVDFVSNATVTSIVTQGHDVGENYVKEYTVMFLDGVTGMMDYISQINGPERVFNATNGTVKQDLRPHIVTQIIRIKPKTCIGNCALRVEFFGWYEVNVIELLGVSNRSRILDSQIRSSVKTPENRGSNAARINASSGWLAEESGDYVETDFGGRASIVEIWSQGYDNEWTNNFTVQMSNDGVNFVDYEEYGARKTFFANIDGSSTVVQKPIHVIFARYVRIVVDFCPSSSIKCSLRLEFVGSIVETNFTIEPISLGMEDRSILGSQIFVSSAKDYKISGGDNARLYISGISDVRNSGRIAAENDNSPWLLVDFITNVTISGISTQGSEERSSYVTEFTLAFGNKRDSIQNYENEDYMVKLFEANYDSSTIVRQRLMPVIVTRFIQVRPISWVGKCALRVEFYGFYEECTDPKPLGMENGTISDSQLTMSTSESYSVGPQLARLNMLDGGARFDGGDTDMYFQIDFHKWTKVIALKTQGAADLYEVIQTFTLAYGADPHNIKHFEEYGQRKTFQGNSETNTVVENRLSRVIFTRLFRVLPVLWYEKAALRMEVLGSYVDTDWFEPFSLGIEDGSILDSQLAVSSQQYSISEAGNARLDSKTLRENGPSNSSITRRYGGWIAGKEDNNPWFQIDFITNATISSILTQGLENETSWVTKYSVSFGYSKDMLQNYTTDGEIKVFSANFNHTSTVRNDVYPYIMARILRIMPKEWIGYCALRVDILGKYDCTNPQPLGLESGIILDSQLSSSSELTILTGAQNARLNLEPLMGVRKRGAKLDADDNDGWIQVDFVKWTLVTGSKTQGFDSNGFIRKFNITYSSNGITFKGLKEHGSEVFSANYDQDTIVEQRFPRVILTRFIRVNPTSWEGGAAIRMEFLGSYVDTDWFDPVPLGMESRLIVDAQITVSSFKDSTSGPDQVRLNANSTTQTISTISVNVTAFNATMNITSNVTTMTTFYVYHGGWIAAENDNNPWFQVDFRTNATVSALITQGLDSGVAWVTAYSLAYGQDKDDLQHYKIDGRVKVFSVDYNDSTTGKQQLYPHVLARFVRIEPKSWIRYCALRVEFYGRYEGCTSQSKPLGMENGTILNSQVSASSENAWQSSAPLARLNLQPVSPLLSGWLPNTADQSPWLQVDFLAYAKITAILTQGDDDTKFVRTFTVSYGNNNEDFQPYKEFGSLKVFRANYEPNFIVKQRLSHIIYARFIRLHPKTGSSGNMGMRTEFQGCYVEPDWFEAWPLGMESHLVLDFQISASSWKHSFSGPDKARLNLNYTFNSNTSEIEQYGSWIAADDDSDPWLQVDFLINVTINGIATQGEDEGEAWVTSYEIAYGSSKSSLQDYQIDQQIKTFNANTDQNSTVRHDFQRPFVARIVRVKPKTCNNGCGMRVEFYGRFEDQNSSTSLGMESGFILDGQITASSAYNWDHRAALGRLNVHPVSGNPWKGWRPAGNDMDKWFQVDFQTYAIVTSIFTQGLSTTENWAKVFIVAFGNDGENFQDYLEFGKPKEFIGNFDKETIVQQRLLQVIFGRFIRLIPIESGSSGSEGLRVDFNGSFVEYECMDPIPLGLEKNVIVNSQLKSSSEKDETTRAANARLGLKPIDGERVGAWVPAADDANPWLNVDFKSNATVRGISTQGRFDKAEWVATYEVSYSIHGMNFETYEENGQSVVFSANFDSNSTVKQYLDPPIFATHIRLHPKECSGSCALRVEFHGCFEDCRKRAYLGLASNVIADSQFNSSSVGAEPAYQARLNKTSTSWKAATDDLNPWIEIDFLMRTKVREIFSQGRDHEDNWVLSYSVSYSSDGKTFQYYTEYGRIKVFSGNQDRASIVRHVLTRIILAYRIRIHPETFYLAPAIRLEFGGCNFGCVFPTALGMEAGYIEDYQISATSSWKYEHKPYYGRLNSHSSWIPDTGAGTHSLEVDFLHTTMLTGFSMQGGFMLDNFVTAFKISLKNGDNAFVTYQENGREKVFLRNADANTTVTYTLPLILVADAISVTAETWNGTQPAMRVEFIGCYEDVDVCESSPCQNNGTCNDHFTTYNFFNCTCPVGFSGRFCETECLDARPLGMSGGQIKDDQFDVYSSLDDESVAPAARLNARAVRKSGGWVAAVDDGNQWFQVDFLVNTTVASILTQGRDGVPNWVETYQVSYSNDSIDFRDYMESGTIKIFDGNSDSDTVVDNILSPRLFTRVIRIHPKTCNLNCSLRAEFLGCYFNVIPSRCLEPIPLGMENKQIKDHQINASSEVYDAKYPDRYAAANGRLQTTMYSRHSAWIGEANVNQWFEVNFIYNTTVKAIMTQGRRDYDQWVKYYQIKYRNHTSELEDYKLNPEVEKIFEGNTDRNTIVNHTLSPVIWLQVIRIIPLDCHDTCALRAEFVGCYEDADLCDPSLCQNNATCNDHFDFFNFFNCTCLPGYTGELCETEINECLSYPCINGGTCNDHINFFNCSCTINYHGTFCEKEVIWPIDNFTVPSLSAHLFGKNISVIWEMDQGSYVTVEVFYNEVLCCNHSMNRHLNYVGSKCNCSITDPNLFDPDGVVDLRIYAYNSVSNVTKTLEVEVLKIIENVAISALTSYASWGIGVKGAGSQQNVYPAEYPVQLSAAFDGGPASIVQWTFDCSVTSAIPDESELSVDKTFPSDTAQLCDIEVTLTNNISSDTASTTIDLRESIIFTSFTYDGPLKPNQSMTFTLSFEKFGQGTCVLVDMGDNSSLLVFGDDSCEGQVDVSQINPNIVDEPRLKFSSRSPATSVITIEHEFPGVGVYPVKMSAKNLLANVTESLDAVVIPFVCKYPNVTITGLAPNDSNLLAATQVYRSVPIFVTTENEIYCEQTNYVVVSWTVYKIVDDPAVLTTTPRMKISDLGKSVFHDGTLSPDLFLPERYLPFGFYEISARVEMKGLPYIFGIGTFYVQIIQTPWIIAAATAGSFYTVPYKELGALNASASIDPDFNNTDGMSFAWYCRSVDDSEFQLSELANEPLITVPGFYPDPDLGGCFGTGRGRLESSGPILDIDTNVMVEDQSYTISLFISTNHEGFAVRQHLTNIYFYVAKGLPPGLAVGCFKNCEAKTARDEKLILKSRCDIRCYGELAFTWTLYSYDSINMPEPYNLSVLNEFPSSQLTEMASSPIDALEIAIKPNTLEPKTKYILAFRAFRPNGVFGELRYTFLTNDAPVDGTCSVSPLSGVAMETNFTFSCENWVDNESPLTVEFLYQIKNVQTTFFYRQIPSGGRTSATVWLVAGDENADYRLNVSAVVKDRMGGKVKQDFAVQVAPQPSVDLNQLQNLVSGEGNAMQDLFESGNSVLAVGLASSIASTLNTVEQNTTSNDSSSTQESDSSKQVRAQLLATLASANLSSKDTSSLEQMSAAVMALTNSDDLDPESQGASLQLTETLTSNMKELSDGDKGFSNILRGASNIVAGVGQMTKNIAKEASNTSNENGASDQVKRSVNLVDNIQGVLLDNLVANEPPLNIDSDELSMQVEKVMLQNLASNSNNAKGAKFGVPSTDALGIGNVVGNPNNTILQMQPVDIKMALVNKNPFSWDNSTSSSLTSNVVDIKMQSNMNISTSNLTEDFSITIPRDTTQFSEPEPFFLKPSHEKPEEKTKVYLKYHRFERKSDFTSINFEMQPDDPGIQFQVYLKKETKPDIMKKDYDLSYELPDLSSCFSGNASNSSAAQSESDKYEAVYVDLRNCTRNPYTVFVSNVDIRGAGRYWFAVEHIRPIENNEDSTGETSRRRRSASCEGEARRVRRSCVIVPAPPPKPTDPPRVAYFEVPDNLGFDGKYFFPNQTPNYNLSLFESSCLYWHEENETWTGEGCKVVLGTNKEQVLCKCNHLTSFGSELLVAPNPIDFDSVFNNFGSLAENVAVLALISTIIGVYIIGVIWARRADKKDDLMVGPTILPKPRGSYHYMITTYTGSRQNSGTTAKVVFKMSGDKGDTCPVRLRDRHRPCFERQQENVFVVSFPEEIGDLSYLQIWHDNSGSSPSWYLSRVVVKDLQTEQTWLFFCENWLAVESEDGKVCRLLSVANEQEMTNFSHLFSARAIKGLADGHIWFSIVSRPPTSNFTRVQRLSCALCLLCCTMITSAMFYNMGGQGPSPFAIHIGSLVIDLKPFVIGLQSSVIIVPVNVLIVQIFRNLRPKKKKEDSEETAENPNGVKIKDPNQEKPKGKLPYWFIYIAYSICYLASAASIFFTLLYSIQWGKETSTEWVIAMVTSFLQSALLLQPIKVVLLAVVFAICIRKPADSGEEANITLEKNQSMEERQEKTPIVTQDPTHHKRKSRKKHLRPPNPAKLKKARIIRLKEIKMNAALKEIFAFFFFLICLMTVAQYHRDPNTYLLSKTLSETFVDVDSFSIPLSWIVDADSLWMWSRETLIPGLYGGEWYNGEKIQKGFLANTEDYLVGIPRVRLLRVEKDSCTVSSYFEDTIPDCNAQYSVTSEDDREYEVGWEPLAGASVRKRRAIRTPETEETWLESVKERAKSSVGASRRKRAVDPIQSGRNRRRKNRLLSSERPKNYTVQINALGANGQVLSCLERWRHQSTLELRGFPYWGIIAMYSGGGYAANLGYDQITAYTVIADLHSNGWIDKQTRAVFVEFTVYNANANLFGIMSIFIEFPSSSGVVTKVQLQAARFYLHLDGGQTLAHVFVIFFMLYFLYREAKLVHKQRWAYFKGFWNWVETILVISEFSLIILFLARLYEVDRNLLQLRENPKDYVGFQYAGQADALMTYILGVLVFFYILRFMRLLRFNKNFLIIGTTLSRICAPILGFLIPFMSGYLAFGLFAFSVFGAELEDYSTFTRAMVTQFSMTLGDFDFEALVSVSLAFGSLYFFAFVGLNIMVLMNIFIAIINDSYADVQEEAAEIENEFELLDYVIGKISEKMTRITSKKPQKKRKKRRRLRVKKIDYSLVVISQSFPEVDRICKRLDKVFDTIENSLEEDGKMELRFHAVPEDKKDSYFKMLCFIESGVSGDSKSPTDIYTKYVELMYLE